MKDIAALDDALVRLLVLLPEVQELEPSTADVVERLLRAMLRADAETLPAGLVAGALGLRSRFALGRMLARSGLPPFVELRSWLQCLRYAHRAAHGGGPLSAHAIAYGRDPSSAARLMKRTMGHGWMALGERAFDVVLLRFRERLAELPRSLPSRRRTA